MRRQNLNDLRIFLCHTTKDKDFVRKLANDLWQFEVIPWLDEWNLEPGDSIHGRIGNALEQCSFVGVILSPDSVKSKWVQKELRQALAREDRTGKKIVIPLLHRSVDLPPFLEDKLYIDFEKSYNEGLGRLIGFVYKLDRRALANAFITPPSNKEELTRILKNVGWQAPTVSDPELYHKILKTFERHGQRDLHGELFRIIIEDLDRRSPGFNPTIQIT